MRTNTVEFTSATAGCKKAGVLCAMLVVAAIAGTPAFAEQRAIARVGLYQNEPKIYADKTGRPLGIFVELLEEIAAAEGWHLEFVPGTWQEGLDRVRRAEIDLMPDVCFTEERALIYTLNNEPALSDWFGVYARKGDDFASILDLNNKRIAMLKGSVQESMFKSMVAGFGLDIELLALDDYDACAQLVRDERADAMVSNRYAARLLSTRYGLQGTPIIFNPTKLHFAAPLSGRQPLLDAIDRRLVEWKARPDSVYYSILKKYTGESTPSFIPAWLRNAFIFISFGLLFFAASAFLLKWQVNRQTLELRMRSNALETALEALRTAQAKAIQQERLHVLGQMAGGLAHDFNNVLTTISGWAELLLARPERFRDMRHAGQYLEKIAEAGRDGAKIVSRMREFYRQRLDTGNCVMVAPELILRDVAELMRPRLVTTTRSHEVKLDVAAGNAPPLLIDPSELREALVNLVGNAIDAMPRGGTVKLSTASDPAGGMVQLCVQDTGVGMSDEVKAMCRNAFFTTKGDKGTGIGLTMVNDFCNRYGGRMEIHSQSGAGTLVRMMFPVVESVQKAQSKAPVSPARIRPLKILAVDDEPSALEVLAALLACDGHVVDGVKDAKTALEKIAGEHYDLVISDWAMPGVSGAQLACRLAKSAPDLPVLILTAALGDENVVDVGGKRTCFVLRKPLERLKMVEALNELGFGENFGNNAVNNTGITRDSHV